MANETFPLHVSAPGEPGSGTTVVGQLDLSEIESALTRALADPAASYRESDASRPQPAKSTVGPHRYTIYVPDTKIRINIGAAHHRQGDSGITMTTQSHFHVFTQEGGNATC